MKNHVFKLLTIFFIMIFFSDCRELGIEKSKDDKTVSLLTRM